MKLLIKQRVFSWTDTFDVYDQEGIPRYFVKGEFFSLGHKGLSTTKRLISLCATLDISKQCHNFFTGKIVNVTIDFYPLSC